MVAESDNRGNLLIQTAFIGDLLLTIPLARRIKKIHPQRPLTLLCRKGLGSLLLATGIVDQVVEVDKKDKESWRQGQKKLKQQAYYWIICPHQSWTSSYLVSGIKAEKKIGYNRWWNFWIFDHRVVRPLHCPEVIRQLFLLKDLDRETEQRLLHYRNGFASWASMALLENEVSPSQLLELRSQYLSSWEQQQKLIFMAPGSVWSTKRWLLAGYIDLVGRLHEKGFLVVLVGAPDEKDLCDQIEGKYPDVVNLGGQTSLLESLYLMRLASVVVANDSGAMHMASAVGAPCVAIFGPTTLNLGYQPWQERSVVVENNNLSCRPCGKHGHKKCPVGTHECMTSVKSSEVLSHVLSLINGCKKN